MCTGLAPGPPGTQEAGSSRAQTHRQRTAGTHGQGQAAFTPPGSGRNGEPGLGVSSWVRILLWLLVRWGLRRGSISLCLNVSPETEPVTAPPVHDGLAQGPGSGGARLCVPSRDLSAQQMDRVPQQQQVWEQCLTRTAGRKWTGKTGQHGARPLWLQGPQGHSTQSPRIGRSPLDLEKSPRLHREAETPGFTPAGRQGARPGPGGTATVAGPGPARPVPGYSAALLWPGPSSKSGGRRFKPQLSCSTAG